MLYKVGFADAPGYVYILFVPGVDVVGAKFFVEPFDAVAPFTNVDTKAG